MNLQINDKVTVAGKQQYRVYNIMNNRVFFGKISQKTGKDLSAMNPHNLLTLTFAEIEKYTKLGTIVK